MCDCGTVTGTVFFKIDGLSMMINVPLYVKVSELNKSGMTDTQEKVISRITEIMIKRYEKQLSEYFASLKEKSKKEEL